jgi:hypothetical protein
VAIAPPIHQSVSLRRQHAGLLCRWLRGGRLQEAPLLVVGEAEHGALARLLRRGRRRRAEVHERGVLGEQVQHVVVDGGHAQVLHQPLAAPPHALGLRRVGVAPVHGVPDGVAHARAPAHRPVVHPRVQAPAEEVLVLRLNQQRHRPARQDVLEAHRPREPLRVDLVPAGTNIYIYVYK